MIPPALFVEKIRPSVKFNSNLVVYVSLPKIASKLEFVASRKSCVVIVRSNRGSPKGPSVNSDACIVLNKTS